MRVLDFELNDKNNSQKGRFSSSIEIRMQSTLNPIKSYLKLHNFLQQYGQQSVQQNITKLS